MASLPVEHVTDAQLLTPDFMCELFEIVLPGDNGVLRIWNGPTRTWQGNVYEFLPCQLSKEGSSTDSDKPRPEFAVMNPNGLFNPYIQAGHVEGATFIRKRVLAESLRNNVNIFERRLWTVTRVSSPAREMLQLELRAPSDGPNFKIPGRVFMPPEFPAVSIR